MVVATTMEQLVVGTPYKEELVDYPYAVAGWEHKQAERRGVTADDLPRRPPEDDVGFAPGTAFVYVMEK